MKNFTFKKEPEETGLAGVGHPTPNTQIKLEKKEVGYIAAPNYRSLDNKWSVRLMVVDASQACGWKWISLKYKADCEREAREWLRLHFVEITTRYTLTSLS